MQFANKEVNFYFNVIFAKRRILKIRQHLFELGILRFFQQTLEFKICLEFFSASFVIKIKVEII